MKIVDAHFCAHFIVYKRKWQYLISGSSDSVFVQKASTIGSSEMASSANSKNLDSNPKYTSDLEPAGHSDKNKGLAYSVGTEGSSHWTSSCDWSSSGEDEFVSAAETQASETLAETSTFDVDDWDDSEEERDSRDIWEDISDLSPPIGRILAKDEVPKMSSGPNKIRIRQSRLRFNQTPSGGSFTTSQNIPMLSGEKASDLQNVQSATPEREETVKIELESSSDESQIYLTPPASPHFDN